MTIETMKREKTLNATPAVKFRTGAIWWSMTSATSAGIRFFWVLSHAKTFNKSESRHHYTMTVQEIPAQEVTLSNGDVYVTPDMTARNGKQFTAEVTRNARFTYSADAITDGVNIKPWNGEMLQIGSQAQ